jgi:hypothetical protein
VLQLNGNEDCSEAIKSFAKLVTQMNMSELAAFLLTSSLVSEKNKQTERENEKERYVGDENLTIPVNCSSSTATGSDSIMIREESSGTSTLKGSVAEPLLSISKVSSSGKRNNSSSSINVVKGMSAEDSEEKITMSHSAVQSGKLSSADDI